VSAVIETRSYAEFTARLHSRVARRRFPIDVSVEVTRRCPLACSHCYNNLPLADPEARSGELTTQEHCRILDQLADEGCLWLLFTGGEIFARPDFLEIYRHAKRAGFLITLFTNGTLLTPRIADDLTEWRPFAIEITLFGRTRETHERLTRVPGSYDRCLEGIRLLRERGLPLTVKTVAVTVNRHELRAMQRFVEQELGLPFRFDAMLTPRIDCSHSPLELRLSPEEIVELDLGDPGRLAGWAGFARDFIGPQQSPGHEADLYHCGGGVQTCAVDPSGRMSVCVMSRRKTFDLRRGTLAEGWSGYLARERGRKIARVTKCTACQLKSVCGMCPANAELECGDPEKPVDFLCHVAHLRALTFGWPLPAHGTCDFCAGGPRRDEIARSALRLAARESPVGCQGGYLREDLSLMEGMR
jgi:radical SAM protein with 4Fe4S-binding SPASM domain